MVSVRPAEPPLIVMETGCGFPVTVGESLAELRQYPGGRVAADAAKVAPVACPEAG